MFTHETGYTQALLAALTVAVVVAFIALAHAYGRVQIFG
jgi:hypothetical protein